MGKEKKAKLKRKRPASPQSFMRCFRDSERPIETVKDDASLPAVFKGYFASELPGKLPTPVQAQAWASILCGKDCLVQAPTGSGKTLAFLLPAVPHVLAQKPDLGPGQGPIALVVAPTHELAQQVAQVAKPLKRLAGFRTVVVHGGVAKRKQLAKLRNNACHLLVGTPGRILDLLEAQELSLNRVTYLVLDECDRMLREGFEAQLRSIENTIRPDRQTLLFSATIPTSMRSACESWIPVRDAGDSAGVAHISVNAQTTSTSSSVAAATTAASAAEAETTGGGAATGVTIGPHVSQVVHVCAEHKKPRKLIRSLTKFRNEERGVRNPSLVLVFCNKIKCVHFVASFLTKQGVRCAALHGKMTQQERKRTVDDFKAAKTPLLVATDVAARGLDVRAIKLVINYDMPSSLSTYVHRVGRTGRQGAAGVACTYFTRNLAFVAEPLAELLKKCGQPVDPNLSALMVEVQRSSRRDKTDNGSGRSKKSKKARTHA